jgi:hypothetical protein
VQSFLATVLHDPSNAGVSYTLSPQVGSVEANGLYRAPAVIAAPVNVTLTVASVADPARSPTATIAPLPVPNPRVTLAAPVSSLSIPAASSGTLLVNLTRVDGYAGEFTLAAAGLPAGVTATFFPKAASPASPAVLQLATGAGVATGGDHRLRPAEPLGDGDDAGDGDDDGGSGLWEKGPRGTSGKSGACGRELLAGDAGIGCGGGLSGVLAPDACGSRERTVALAWAAGARRSGIDVTRERPRT